MIAVIEKSTANGSVTVPPSKSVAHRLLINAALTNDTVKIKNLPMNDDISATIACLKDFGAKFSFSDEGECTVCGIDKSPRNVQTDFRRLHCRESGSTLRFLIPTALSDGIKTEFTGAKRLFERPLDIYREICKKNGFLWEQTSEGIVVQGKLMPDTYSFPGNISSQFITGLLLSLPELEGDSTILLTTEPESDSYVDLTVDSLEEFGIKVIRKSQRELYIPGSQERRRTGDLYVEGDESGAAFFAALNTFGGEVALKGLSENSKQGDRVWRELFEQIKNSVPVISIKDCPDLGPILMALAAMHNGAMLTDTARLKLKESDRGNAMAQELAKCGVDVTVEENSILIHGGQIKAPSCTLHGHNDHRIVMALAVLLTAVGGKIDDAQAVNKSMPTFWELFKGIGCKAELFDNE